jgi:hypothetical protein
MSLRPAHFPRHVASAAIVVLLASAEAAPFRFTVGSTATSAQQCSDSLAPVASFDGPVSRFASLVARGEKLILVGNDVQSFDVPLRNESLFSAMGLDGVRLPQPSGGHTFLRPRAAFDTSGALQLLWAEPAPPIAPGAEFSMIGMRYDAIWSANYTAQAGWSRPELLSRGGFSWGREATDDIASDGAVRILIANLLFTTSLFVYDRQTWSTRVAFADRAAAANSIAVRGGMVFRAMLASAGPGDVNSVFFARSVDTGRTWQTSKLVSASGRLAAQDVKLRLGRDGRLHLFWTQTDAESGLRLLHVESMDAGETWSRSASTPIGTTIPGLQAATDGCDRIHLAVTHIVAPGVRDIHHWVWDGQWIVSRHLFGELTPSEPALATTESGRVVLTFLGVDPKTRTRTTFATDLSVVKK